MIELDFNACRTQPFAEFQKVGVKAIVRKPNFALFDDMGLGKSWQAIVAACFEFQAGLIDTVVLVAPASVRLNWLDEDFGQISEHTFVPSLVEEFSNRRHPTMNVGADTLHWVGLSYDLMRQNFKDGKQRTWSRIEYLNAIFKRRRVRLIFDESIKLKTPGSQQSLGAFELRRQEWVKRCLLLNGTPLTNHQTDLYTQFAVLDKSILNFKNYYHFRARHCVMGGYNNKQIIKFVDEESFNKKLAPYILRRTKEEVLDLLPKRYQVREVRLKPATWKIYCAMRDEMVAWLDNQPSVCKTAGVRVLRLAQIASGFLGGVTAEVEEEAALPSTKEIGREKLDDLLEWYDESEIDRLAIWCRFKPEMDRLRDSLAVAGKHVFEVRGGQKRSSRLEAMAEAKSGTRPGTAIISQYQAGGLGLDYVSIHYVARISRDYNLYFHMQAEDRHQRKGQLHQVLFTDFVACGPDGQKTVDHKILKALKKKEDLARYTTQQWKQILV